MRHLILFGVLMACMEACLSMQCVPEDVETYYSAADFVFEGVVVKRTKIDEENDGFCPIEGETCGPKIATINVGRAWKGDFSTSEISVYSGDGCYCLGTYFTVGDRYLVFGRMSDQKEYKVVDMEGCATEFYANVEPKDIEKLDALKAARANDQLNGGAAR